MGIHLRLIQQGLGHESLSTTAIYTHLTRNAETLAGETMNRLMAPLTASEPVMEALAPVLPVAKALPTGETWSAST